MTALNFETEIVIAGGGLAGIITAHELLNHGHRVLLIDKDTRANFGGLAKKSFGGVHIIGTPHQKRLGLEDDPELAYEDWLRCARFGEGDEWPRRWARYYCENSLEDIFHPLDERGVEFLPIVNWPERGLDHPHNTIPRWHIAWGTGYEIIDRSVKALEAHKNRSRLELLFEHEVSGLVFDGDRVVGITGKRMSDGAEYEVKAEHVIIASGGMCGGDLSKVRANWYEPWGEPPEILLNGAHRYGDGMLHDVVASHGGAVTHLDKQWHYAAGVHHPDKSRPHDGLSLVPPRSAIWVNALGHRIGPRPLVPYTDTRHLVERICQEPGKYSWQVLNRKIALKELAVSGCDFMTAFRYKDKIQLAKDVIFGNHQLVDRLIRECPDDFVVANTLEELVAKMNERSLFGLKVDGKRLRKDIEAYDAQIERGEAFHNDEQLRWISSFRKYRGDKIRTAKFQKILDPKAGPLIAIREFILARKSLGGIRTDLSCRVLKTNGEPISGLYAVGEAAGFGGGGIHGLGSLEGTFLGGCVLTARVAGRSIGRA
ncbi:MAG: FAD-binding protein [Myxococcales bacterium]|nr:FAD-binding protein [Myxococcales bacterium]